MRGLCLSVCMKGAFRVFFNVRWASFFRVSGSCWYKGLSSRDFFVEYLGVFCVNDSIKYS